MPEPALSVPGGALTPVVDLAAADCQLATLRALIAEHLRAGEDYAVLAGQTTPTLLKPGAEKLCWCFGLTIVQTTVDRVAHWQRRPPLFAIESRTCLIARASQQLVATGHGACNSWEPRLAARWPAPMLQNVVCKLAHKRSLVDATLKATRASGCFTQDLEDWDRAGSATASARARTAAGPCVGRG